MNKLKLALLAICETRVKCHKKDVIWRKRSRGWSWCDNYQFSPKGRLRIGWDPVVISVQVLHIHEQYMNMSLVHRQSMQSLMFTAVYGLHTLDDKKVLWSDPSNLAPQFQSVSWMIMGDLNAVMLSSDRMNGALITTHEMQDLSLTAMIL